MQLSITQFQAGLIKQSLKLYNIEMLSSSEEWKEYDILFDKLAELSDTRGDAVFNNKGSDSKYKHGKDLDLIW